MSSNQSSTAGPWCTVRLYVPAVAVGGRRRNLFLLSKLLLKLLRHSCKKHCRHSGLETVLYLDTNNVFPDKGRGKFLKYEISVTKRGGKIHIVHKSGFAFDPGQNKNNNKTCTNKSTSLKGFLGA